MDTHEDQWERFLDPDVVREELHSALFFIATFEILKDSVVERIRSFYSIGFDQNGPEVDPDYRRKVLSRNKSPLYASFDWLLEHQAINESDLQLFEDLKAVRNTLAHELFAAVTGQISSSHSARLPDLISLLRKIEAWWVANVEIPTNPDYDGQPIDESSIVPGPILGLQMLIEVASGNTELLEHYRKAKRNRH